MKLYGDSLHYFGGEEKAYLYGNVKLITNQILLKYTTEVLKIPIQSNRKQPQFSMEVL